MGVDVLVTGGLGFVGGRLARRLSEDRPEWTVDAPDRFGRDGRAGLDVTDVAAVDAWMSERPPRMVVHLAAIAAVTASVKEPREAWRVNLEGTLNVVMSLQAHAPGARLLFVSSAEVYGLSLDGGAPVNETALLQPVNPYAASKAAADILVRQAAAAGLATTVARPFNHTGAGQSEAFVAASFAGQIARIEAGLQPPVLHVGSLDDERDFLDVDDVVAAYIALLAHGERCAPGEVFNVASGRAVRIGDLLETLLSQARVAVEVRVEASRLRQVPVTRVVGDASRLRERLDWTPRTPLADTLSGLLNERRRSVAGAPSA